jgi:hypothetical protein
MAIGESPKGGDGYFSPATPEEFLAIGGIMAFSETQWKTNYKDSDPEFPDSDDIGKAVERLQLDLERERILEEGYFSD